MPFQLLSLPHVAIIQIFNGMLTEELLEVVSEQKDLQRFCHAVGIRSGGYNITLRKSEFSIFMLKTGYSSSNELYYCKNIPTLMNRFFKSFEYVKEAFPGEIKTLEVCPIAFSKYLHLIPTECSVLSIGNSEWEADGDYFMKECSDKVLEQLINKTNFKHGLSLEGPTELKTKNQKMFNIEYLNIIKAAWITPSILGQLQNRMIYLYDVTFSDEDVNNYLKNVNTNLEFAKFTKNYEWNMEKVLDGLNATFVEQQQNPMTISEDDPLKLFVPIGVKCGSDLYYAYNVIRSDGTRLSVQPYTDSICIYVSKNRESRKRGRNVGEVNESSAKKNKESE